MTPGLEALHVLIGDRDGIGILLVYRAPLDSAISLPELADFVSAALLGSPRLLVLGDFNIHAEMEVSGPVLDFLGTMASWDMSQNVNGPIHVGGHMLDLVFSSEQRECGLMVTNLVSIPLSWLDHHLIKCNLTVALLHPGGAGIYFNGPPSQATGSHRIPGLHARDTVWCSCQGSG